MTWLKRTWPIALLVALLWVARYWHSGHFGFYEDDLTHLPTAAAMSLSQVVSFAFNPGRILRLEGNGHPIHYTFMYLLTNLGWRLASLRGLYWIGFSIQALNVCLFYLLLKRIQSWQLGFLGGLAYVLYSADTTQAFLTFSLGFHPALTLYLLACLAYVSGKRWLAYLLAPTILLTYETAFPLLLAIPLLVPRAKRERVRELLAHMAILGGILLGSMVWRTVVGDDRLGGLTARELLLTPLLHMVQGPPVNLGTYFYRPLQTVLGIDVEIAGASVLGIAFFAVLFSRLRLDLPEGLRGQLAGAIEAARRATSIRTGVLEGYRRLTPRLASLLRLTCAGAAMLVLAYPLTFTIRAYAISGRDTRVHSAAVLGAALFVGSLSLLALWAAEGSGRRRWVAAAFGIWFGLLAGYGFVIQRDYRLAWIYQQQFWTELVRLVPDVSEGDSILVDPSGLNDTRQIGANYWNLPVVLEQLYQFPDSWRRPVWVYRLEKGWEDGILGDDGRLQLDGSTTYAPPSTYREVDPGETILIETGTGELVRRSAPLILDGKTIMLKVLDDAGGEPPYPPGFLYRFLVTPRDES